MLLCGYPGGLLPTSPTWPLHLIVAEMQNCTRPCPQDIFNLLPNMNVESLSTSLAVKGNDMMAVIYLASLIRRCVTNGSGSRWGGASSLLYVVVGPSLYSLVGLYTCNCLQHSKLLRQTPAAYTPQQLSAALQAVVGNLLHTFVKTSQRV